VCRHHHERHDGKGYPDGLKGDEIPLSAQLVSLADVYDALVSERVYKKAFSKDVAYNMIMDGECGTFSPKLIKCLEYAKEAIEAFVEVRL
jgi:putative two-component system response regulator